jgi:hypothetical protein
MLHRLLGLVAAVALVSCAAAGSDGTPVGDVMVAGARVELTQREHQICARRAAGHQVHCFVRDAAGDGDVLAALYEADGAANDLVMIATAPDVAISGLGPGAVRAVVASGAGGAFALWLAHVPSGGHRLCLASRRPGQPAAPLVVNRTAVVAAGAMATLRADRCA